MRMVTFSAITILIVSSMVPASAQRSPRTLVAVFAHGDDETPVGPILARSAREGEQVYLIIATDGAQGEWTRQSHEAPSWRGCVARRFAVPQQRSEFSRQSSSVSQTVRWAVTAPTPVFCSA